MSSKMREQSLSSNLTRIFCVFCVLVLTQSNPKNKPRLRSIAYVITLLHLQRLDQSAESGVCKCARSVLKDRKWSDSGCWVRYPNSQHLCPPQTYSWSSDFISWLRFCLWKTGIGKGTTLTDKDLPKHWALQNWITSGGFTERLRKITAYKAEPTSLLRLGNHASSVPSQNYTPLSRARQQTAISAKFQCRYIVCRGILENYMVETETFHAAIFRENSTLLCKGGSSDI